MGIIRDFIDFLKIRKAIEVTNPLEDKQFLEYIVNRYDEDIEEKINSNVLNYLIVEMIKSPDSRDYYRWFRSALDYRIQLLRNNRKLLKKN